MVAKIDRGLSVASSQCIHYSIKGTYFFPLSLPSHVAQGPFQGLAWEYQGVQFPQRNRVAREKLLAWLLLSNLGYKYDGELTSTFTRIVATVPYPI